MCMNYVYLPITDLVYFQLCFLCAITGYQSYKIFNSCKFTYQNYKKAKTILKGKQFKL